jgi:hypothetical protein
MEMVEIMVEADKVVEASIVEVAKVLGALLRDPSNIDLGATPTMGRGLR